MKQENSSEYLRKITKSMHFLSKKAQKEAYKRGLEVLPEVLALKKFASKKPSIQETRDIARQQFLMGVQRYLIGFYENSIHYTTMSVEMGLLIRLNEELSAEQKEEIHARINAKEKPLSFTFGRIFGMCKKRELGIIRDGKISEKVGDIIDTRNTYIHASNINSASLSSMKESVIPEIDKSLIEVETIEDVPEAKLFTKWLPIAKERLNKSGTAIMKVDSMEWCTRDRERIQAKKKVDAFFHRIFATIQGIRNTPESRVEQLKLGLRSGALLKSLTQENYDKRIALSTINDAFEVLKSLDIPE